MADQKGDQKSLEMRVAAMEDKLSKMAITEQDMQGYQKVAAAMAANPSRQSCIAASNPASFTCLISTVCHIVTISVPVHIPIIVNDCIQAGAGGATSTSGFGSLGT